MRSNLIAKIIICVFVLLSLSYTFNTPAFEPPDELAHFLYAHNLLETGELPTLHESREVVFSSQATHRHHPPLYYAISAVLIAPFNRDDLDAYRTYNPLASIGVVQPNNQNAFLHPTTTPNGQSAQAIIILRMFSITLGAGTLWMIYRIGAVASGEPSIGLLSEGLVALIPTFIFISSSINNDNLATFFYTAGILWLVERRAQNDITWRNITSISLILAGIALTKVNGLSLFGLIYAGLIIFMWKGHFSWRDVRRTIIASAITAILLAGWWYLRNWSLYGDPLAVNAASVIWGREAAPSSLSAWLDEIGGIWQSFWMVLGQFNIRGPEWVLITGTLITLGGIVSYLSRWRRHVDYLLVLGGAILLVTISLIVATMRINISQGRLLYPMLGGFSVIVAWGWWMILRRRAFIILIPMTIAALIGIGELQTAYHPLETVTISDRVNAYSGDHIALYDYIFTIDDQRVHADIAFEITETPPLDYALSIALIDPVTGILHGSVTSYPGMTFTSQLEPDTYQTQLTFDLTPLDQPQPPRQLQAEIKWITLESIGEGQVDIVDTLPWTDGANNSLGQSLIVPAITYVDPRYEPAQLVTNAQVKFGESILLEEYTLTEENQNVILDLRWNTNAPILEDWTLTIQILDEENNLITQQDSPIPGYPTSVWKLDTPFTISRTLNIEDNIPYKVVVGWYNESGRLPVHEADAIADLLILNPY